MRGGTLVATNITKEYGATVVLDGVSLTVPPGARIGVVGPNGSGKSTLLRVLAGVDEPTAGASSASAPSATCRRSPSAAPGETLLGFLARRTGVARGARARDGRRTSDGSDARSTSSSRSAAAISSRARARCARELGIACRSTQELPTLSGGEAARVSLAALLLSRFDVLCLDEPTNDLDFDGLERLERFVAALRRLDRPRLARPRVPRPDGDAHRRVRARRRATCASSPGTYADVRRASARARSTRQERAYADYVEERDRFEDAARRAPGAGAPRASISAGARRRRSSRRSRRRSGGSSGSRRSRSRGARGGSSSSSRRARAAATSSRASRAPWSSAATSASARSTLDVGWGDRVAIVGPNGAGKTTLLRALTRRRAARARRRATIGTGVVARRARPAARALRGRRAAARTLPRRVGAARRPRRGRCSRSSASAARTRCGRRGSLSPGERSRAVLALLQARGVNCLVLDEPTNHLDLEAIEQLEEALADYAGHGAARHARPALPRALRADADGDALLELVA